MIDLKRVIKAMDLATFAHSGQFRKLNGNPYIVHPRRVALRLFERFQDDTALVVAGWCHDVLEDCQEVVSAQKLHISLGTDAFSLVCEVTNVSVNFKHLNRAERKAMDRQHLASASNRAKCLKLVDRTDNLKDMLGAEKDWLRVYVNESKELAKVLAGTDKELENELQAAIMTAEKESNGV